jgi:hypothetical protein
MNWFSKWMNKKVPWYYIWYPGSGIVGGIIMGIIILIICSIISYG